MEIITSFNFKKKVAAHCSYNLHTAFPAFQSSTQPWNVHQTVSKAIIVSTSGL